MLSDYFDEIFELVTFDSWEQTQIVDYLVALSV